MSRDEKSPAGSKSVHIGQVSGNVYLGERPEHSVDAAINELLLSLANQPFAFERTNRRPSAQTIEKIHYNNIQSKSHIIKQYLDHSAKIEEAFNSIDSIITFGKHIILQSLNDLYCSALDAVGIDYLTGPVNTASVRENSEFILDFIIKQLRNTAFEAKNTPVLKEHIDLGVNVVVAHAFIECIILENPNNDS